MKNDNLPAAAASPQPCARVYPIPVVCALIIRDGRVLLERHAPSYGHMEPFWDIPGGKLECGETPEQAVVREIREEMRVEIEIVAFIPRLDVSVWIDKHWLLATYECRIVSGQPPLSDELAWIEIDRLGFYDVKSPDLEIIQSLAQGERLRSAAGKG